jgi:predicted nucleotide-binding protein (sugar kinase/HSP70/actin superfamily)
MTTTTTKVAAKNPAPTTITSQNGTQNGTQNGIQNGTQNGIENGTNKYKDYKRHTYIPYMCDHGYMLAAAMRSHGLPAEVLTPTTTKTREIGLHYCRGSECLPCITTTGDIMQRARHEDFDPQQAAVFMPTTAGSCRFGCYNVLQKEILAEHGLAEVDFLSPSASNSYQGLGEKPQLLRLLIWEGAVAGDILHKLLHGHRPYERNKGQTDVVYQQSLDRVVAAVEAGGGKELVEAMRWVGRQFERIPLDKSTPRPMIGIVGEIYLRFNKHVNLDLPRQVEQAGGEVQIAGITEWLYYTNWTYIRDAWFFKNTKRYVKMRLTDAYQRHLEHNILKPVEHLIKHPHDPHVSELMANLTPYYHSDLHSEAILSMGSAIDFGKRGFDGLLNVMPFSCMPGTITAGIAPRMRADLDNIPWLDISYDAQEGTNIKTRLEAFMYQAAQFQRRKARQTQQKKAS